MSNSQKEQTNKGKEKASSDQQQQLQQQKQQDDNPSLTHRLIASANMAAQSLTSTLSSSSSQSKASSYSSNPSQQHTHKDIASKSTTTTLHPLGSSLRDAQNYNYAEQPSHIAFTQFLDGPTSLSSHSHITTQEPFNNTNVSQAEALDGSDVITLLSLPEIHEDPHQDLLSPSTITNLRSALFSNSSSNNISWDNLLNLIPYYISNPTGDHDTLHHHLGTQDSNDAMSIWLQQWNQVMTSYTDDVWGDLSSLVAEAKAEIDSGGTGSKEEVVSDGSALGRLRMILAHVRG